MTSILYEYGLLAPTAEATNVDEQIWLAHRYRNRLIEIERDRRTAVRAAMSAHPMIEPLEAEVAALAIERETAYLAIRATRKEARTRAEDPSARQALRELGARLQEARARLKAAKQALRDDAAVQAQIAATNERDHETRIKARSECGVYWGTYLLIEAAADQARKELMDPQFRRFCGNGAVGVQLQGGMTVADLYGCTDTRLQLDAVPEAAWMGSRADRRRLGHTMLRLRVGSEGRAPIWASWPCVMHRPLPEGAIIKAARVIRRRHGWRSHKSHDTWRLQLTVTLPDGYQREAAAPAGTMVAVNLGWRDLASGLRVATWRDEAGESGHLVLDSSVVTRLRSIEAIHSHRDMRLDVLRAWLGRWLRDSATILPPWLVEQTVTLHAWRAPARFSRLARMWRTQRFAGDEGTHATLEAWRQRDQHLYAYEDGRRDRALGCRREQYRRFAAELARRYETLVLDDVDLRAIARHKPLEAEEADHRAGQDQRVIASPSLLRQCLRDAFRARGGRVLTVPAKDRTRTCHVCGQLVIFDAAQRLRAECPCGVSWDQDDNWCYNALSAARERLPAVLATEAARAKDPEMVESRWVRAKRIAREKREAARAKADNSIDGQGNSSPP